MTFPSYAEKLSLNTWFELGVLQFLLSKMDLADVVSLSA